MSTDDPVIKAMREMNPAFVSMAQRLGTAVALEGLANILVMNLAAAYGEEVAIATLAEIAANAATVAHIWDALAAAQNQEPGHA
jgi:uncharacterized membrane protein